MQRLRPACPNAIPPRAPRAHTQAQTQAQTYTDCASVFVVRCLSSTWPNFIARIHGLIVVRTVLILLRFVVLGSKNWWCDLSVSPLFFLSQALIALYHIIRTLPHTVVTFFRLCFCVFVCYLCCCACFLVKILFVVCFVCLFCRPQKDTVGWTFLFRRATSDGNIVFRCMRDYRSSDSRSSRAAG